MESNAVLLSKQRSPRANIEKLFYLRNWWKTSLEEGRVLCSTISVVVTVI